MTAAPASILAAREALPDSPYSFRRVVEVGALAEAEGFAAPPGASRRGLRPRAPR